MNLHSCRRSLKLGNISKSKSFAVISFRFLSYHISSLSFSHFQHQILPAPPFSFLFISAPYFPATYFLFLLTRSPSFFPRFPKIIFLRNPVSNFYPAFIPLFSPLPPPFQLISRNSFFWILGSHFSLARTQNEMSASKRRTCYRLQELKNFNAPPVVVLTAITNWVFEKKKERRREQKIQKQRG